MFRRIGPVALVVASLLLAAPAAAAPTPGPEPLVSAADGVPSPAPAAAPSAPDTQAAAWARLVGSAPGAGVPDSPAPAAVIAADAALTVEPDTGLVAGQTVAVSASGLPATELVVAQCEAGIEALFDCATAPGTCEVAIGDFTGAVVARHAVSFDPDAPLPVVTLTVTPSTGLVDGTSVSVTGAGFRAGQPVYVRQCAGEALSCSGPSASTVADDAGAIETALAVRLLVPGARGDTTTCLVVECIVRATSLAGAEYEADAALAFDPAQPVPALPAITVTPATGLRHGQEVTVVGTGFDPSAYVDLAECPAEPRLYCGEYVGFAESDASGGFTTTVPVTRLVGAFGTALEVVDCATSACELTATSYGDEGGFPLAASAPLGFDASVPPPPLPTATVTPSTDLPYRATVAVHGEDFAPGTPVYAEYCVESAVGGSCGSSFEFGTTDASGAVDLSIAVKRRLATFDGGPVLDCLDPGTECLVRIFGQRSYERVDVPVTFDPDAPIPPPPTATLDTDAPLGWRQSVGVTGSGFAPGFVTLAQCGPFSPGGGSSFEVCGEATGVTVGADGSLHATVTLRRMLDFGFASPIDCAAVACTLRIGSGDPDETVVLPLAFDPGSEPPPPPVLALYPPGPVLDGRTTLLAGRGFAPGATVALTECTRESTSIADGCDLGHIATVTASSDGTIVAPFDPVGVYGTAGGLIDCTARPCSLAAVNVDDHEEFTSLALDFEAPELELHSTSVTEGTGGTTEAHVMVELSEPIGSDTVVEWHTTAGTAGPDDFVARHGRVTIPAGATEAMIHATVVADALDEPTERFTVDVGSALGTVVTDGRATVTIRDDDAAPSVTLADGTGREGDDRGRAVITLSAPSGREIVVKSVPHHGTARSGSDYLRIKHTLVFHPGETRHVLRPHLVDDHVPEPDEWFTLELYDVDNASIARGEARITITDDD